jgi:HEAT repeat protein
MVYCFFVCAALPQGSGNIKIELINALGERRQPQNVEMLHGLLEDPDAAVSTAAMVAIGKMDDASALESLAKARRSTTPVIREAAARASVDCATHMLAHGQKEPARALFDEVYAADLPGSVRAAAFQGCVSARGEEGIGLLTEVIRGQALELWACAMQADREIPGKNATDQLAALVPVLSGERKAQLMHALADRGDKAALPAVLAAVDDPDDLARTAAYEALALFGDGAAAVKLAKNAAKNGPDADKARA